METPAARPRRRRRIAVLLAAGLALAAPAAPASAQDHDHGHGDGGGPPAAGSGRVGLLIADHGEPPVYNADTYESIRAFMSHLIDMGVIPPALRAVDGGTVLQDPGCYACAEPRVGGGLIDAWLRRHDGGAVPVPGSEDLPAHHLRPGGPGFGEPDIFEHAGLITWHEWELMGGWSPNYDQKLAKKRIAMRALRRRFGRDLPIRVGYGIDPRIGGGRQGMDEAVTALIRRDRVRRIAVVYHGVGFSDIMQTHMLRHEIEHTVQRLDPSVQVSYAKPLGFTRAYTQAVVRKAEAEVHRLPRDARVAIHLSGHGLPTDRCGDYDCGADAYHDTSRRLFDHTSRALQRHLAHHAGVGVFRLYGDGAEGDDDPGDEVDSPTQALAKRRAAGYTHVVDIPYEFDADSRDTLIVLRQGYRRPIPDWNRRYESHFSYEGLPVKITNASFGARLKARALTTVAAQALREAR